MLDVGDIIVPDTDNIRLYAQWGNKGDINADGAVNKKDAALLLKYICGTCKLTEGQMEMAEMNGDDVIDMLDVIAVLNIAN